MRSGLDFAVNSEPIIRFAFWSGFCAMALTLLLIAWIVILRAIYLRNERRKHEFLSIWRGLLTDSALTHLDPRQLPVIADKDVVFFLPYWSHLQNSLRGETRERLNFLARSTGIDRAARRMLQEGSHAEKLLAIVSLGHLGEKTDTEVLEKLLASEHPIACLYAVRALLHIDLGTLGELMPIIVQRSDLPTTAIANVLKEAGLNTVSPILADMLRHAFLQGAAPQHMVRLIALTVVAHPSVVHASLREIMDQTEDAEVLAACLKVMRDPCDLSRVRELIGHPDWRVRVHAAAALGDMGEEKDMESLIKLLSDSQWWVRYRAAQAISRMPFVTAGGLKGIRKHLDDPFAIDMLNQVISERMS